MMYSWGAVRAPNQTMVTQWFGLDYSKQWDVLQHHVASLSLDGGGESDM